MNNPKWIRCEKFDYGNTVAPRRCIPILNLRAYYRYKLVNSSLRVYWSG